MSYFRLVHNEARKRAASAIMDAPDGYIVRISEPTRTLESNALLWVLLGEVSKQVEWYFSKLTAEEWKDVFSASLKKQKAVPGIDGGFVVCGQRTSKMTKSEFSDLIELIYAFGAIKGVNFGDSKP